MSTTQMVDVKVEQGILRGRNIVTEDGLKYSAFRGIPYAQPPVGPLRFKAPRPPIPWEGVRSALEEGPVGRQKDRLQKNKMVGSEDCLYLNVYTPQVPSSTDPSCPESRGSSPLPIMVWLHPGCFVSGSGSAREYGPELLVAKDVVIVTLNYRLGVLGLLCLESPAATGNYTLKDMVAALRWVKANGAAFGGDIENITVFGNSMGSMTVQLLQLSPLSKGLFHKGIAQSASCLCPIALLPNRRDSALRLARFLGATADVLKDDEKILELLRAQTADVILEASTQILSPRDMEVGSTYLFTPVSEGNIVPNDPEDEVFLPGYPLDLLRNGPVIDIPLIMGLTDLEGTLVDAVFPPSSGLTSAPAGLMKLNKNIEKCLPKLIRDHLPLEKQKEAGEGVRKLYFKGGNVDKLGYYKLQTDLIITNSISHEVRLLARFKSSPIYVYCFRVKGKINRFSPMMAGQCELKGASHGDELNYLWTTQPPLPRIPKLSPLSLEARTRERMVTMWTNFAKTGNPTPVPVDRVRWPRVPKDVGSSIPYLDIDEELTVPKTGLFEENIKFWDSVYAQIGFKI